MLLSCEVFNNPPIIPPPFFAPRRGQRREPGFGCCAPATLLRRVTSRSSSLAEIDEPAVVESTTLTPRHHWRLRRPAAKPVSLTAGRRAACRQWRIGALPFTTTASQQSRLTSSSRDATPHRSLSKTPKIKSRPPSLPPAGGKEGRGDDWGVVKRLARDNDRENTRGNH